MEITIIRPGGLGDVIDTLPSVIHLMKSHHVVYYTSPEIGQGLLSLIEGLEVRDFTAPHQYEIMYNGDAPCSLIGIAKFFKGDTKVVTKRPRGLTEPLWHVRSIISGDIVKDLSSIKTILDEPVIQGWGMRLGVDVSEQDIVETGVAVRHTFPTQSQSGTHEKTICIQADASSPLKALPPSSIIDLANSLSEKYNVVVVGSVETRKRFLKLADYGKNKDIVWKLGITLAEIVEIVAFSSAVVAHDSGVLHLAAILNVPSVALMGPSLKRDRFKDFITNMRFINCNKSVKCAPCWFRYTHECMNDYIETGTSRCMRSISARKVKGALRALVE